MKNKSGKKEINEIIQLAEQQLNKFKQENSDRRWLLFIPLILPLLSPGLGIIGIIILFAYLICTPTEN